MNVIQRFLSAFNKQVSSSMGIYYTMGSIAVVSDKFSSVAFACVDAIISRATQARPKLVSYTKEGEAEREFDHPLLQALNRPNKQQTWRDLISWTVGYRETKGNTFWWMVPALNGKNIVGFRVLNPDHMEISDDKNGNVIGYVYTTDNGTRLPFKAEEIVAFPYFNPESQLRGIGPLQAARLAQENDQLAQAWNNKLFKNGAMPSGVLTTDQKIDQKIFDRIKENWQKQYGGEANMAKTAILEAGLKYERLSLSQADMAFYEGRRDAREEIMMNFRVPKAALGMSEGVNRASAEATLYSFAELKVQPMVESIFERINEFVLPHFGLNPRQTVLEFNSLVPENRELELKEQTDLLKNGVMTINEVRSRRGLADVEWGDKPFAMNKAENESPDEVVLPEEKIKKLNGNKDNERALKEEYNHKLYRSKIDKESMALEKEFLPKIKAAHKEVQTMILDYISEAGKQRGLFGDLNLINNKILNAFLNPITLALTTSYYRSGKLTIKYLGMNDGDIALENPAAVEWITKHALEDASSVTATLRAEITPIIAGAITDGLSTFQLTEKLTTYFTGLTDWKARQIAHTEVHKAISAAAHLAAEATDRELFKCWSDSGDDRVCETCNDNSAGGYIPMKELYPSGAMHPEDSHPNCRCREYFEPASRHKK